jgi:hypothetical protein
MSDSNRRWRGDHGLTFAAQGSMGAHYTHGRSTFTYSLSHPSDGSMPNALGAGGQWVRQNATKLLRARQNLLTFTACVICARREHRSV